MSFPKHIRSGVALMLVLALVVVTAPEVFAADYTSTHFKARRPIMDIFGGTATSSNFTSISSGGEIATGEATSTSFLLNAGQMYFDATSSRVSMNWRWYDDANNETPSDDLAAENVSPTNIDNSNPIKLRITLKDISANPSYDVKLSLQYSTSSDFDDGGNAVVEIGSCTGSSVWCYANGVDTDNDVITAGLLTDSDSCVASVGDGCGTHNETGTTSSSFIQSANAATEYEFTIQQSGGVPNTVYFFRAVDIASGDAIPLSSGETYPSLSTNGTILVFSIDGVTAASTTEGVTTDIHTTPTDVPFGTLTVGATTTAAQQLTVSTNATNGYRVFAYTRQGFLRDGSGEIPPIPATNDTPDSWLNACTSSATGCYGYHTGADVLSSGNTTRFAPNDTYAQFTSTPTEIAYSPVAANDSVTKMIYRVRANELQDAGNYSTTIVYIATPVF